MTWFNDRGLLFLSFLPSSTSASSRLVNQPPWYYLPGRLEELDREVRDEISNSEGAQKGRWSAQPPSASVCRNRRIILKYICFPPNHVSKVHKYREEELDEDIEDAVIAKTKLLTGLSPFSWQLDCMKPIMCGKMRELVCIDVGTGSVKSLCFILPLLLHDKDLALVVSPLSALMIDQVSYSAYRLQNPCSILILLCAQLLCSFPLLLKRFIGRVR